MFFLLKLISFFVHNNNNNNRQRRTHSKHRLNLKFHISLFFASLIRTSNRQYAKSYKRKTSI